MTLSETLIPYEGKLKIYNVSFTSLGDIDKQINELELDRQGVIRQLAILAAGNPSELFGRSGDSIDTAIDNKLNDIIDTYDDIVRKISSLMLAKRVIEQYKFSSAEGMSDSVAFDKAVIDKWADVREKINKSKD